MSRVAIVTDSASDLTAADAAAAGITVVPLEVSFGAERFKAGVDPHDRGVLDADDGARRPVPEDGRRQRRRLPGHLREALRGRGRGDRVHRRGGDPVGHDQVRRTIAARRCCRIGRSTSSTRARPRWATGLLALMAARWPSPDGRPPTSRPRSRTRKADLDLYVALDTLEYLKRGGRISGAQAAIGTLLSVKPIITIKDGVGRDGRQAADPVAGTRAGASSCSRRGRSSGSASCTRWPRTSTASATSSSGGCPAGSTRASSRSSPSGPSVGPHLGPGCIGAVVLYAR